MAWLLFCLDVAVRVISAGYSHICWQVVVLMNDGLSQDAWDRVLSASHRLESTKAERFGVALGKEVSCLSSLAWPVVWPQKWRKLVLTLTISEESSISGWPTWTEALHWSWRPHLQRWLNRKVCSTLNYSFFPISVLVIVINKDCTQISLFPRLEYFSNFLDIPVFLP